MENMKAIPMSQSAGIDAPKVCIVITHYNYTAWIEKSIQSVFAQTHTNWELVIVDDCSKAEEQGTLRNIVARYADPRLSLIENTENMGQLAAFYLGIQNTKADFVGLLDPDDSFFPDYL